jgi:hypothetical protein
VPVPLGVILTTQVMAALIGPMDLCRADPLALGRLCRAYRIAWIFIEELAKLAVYYHLNLTGTKQQRFLSRVRSSDCLPMVRYRQRVKA